MALPRVVVVAPGSPADRAGVPPGDEIVALDCELRDIIENQSLADEENLGLEVNRGGIELALEVHRVEANRSGWRSTPPLSTRCALAHNDC